MDMLADGVPPDTIAVIDDAGGTLTAPILEGFTGIICKGGTIKSHLGVLSREYAIPCLMGAELSGVAEGDRVRIESTKNPPDTSAEAARAATRDRARIWKIAG
jgi:phosphoenolpyruvate-protein kinase (PTS system EI component)